MIPTAWRFGLAGVALALLAAWHWTGIRHADAAGYRRGRAEVQDRWDADRLRAAAPDLLFAFLEISRTDAQARVTARAASHFFSTSLVDNQFATLQSPTGETGVLTLNAMQPLDDLQAAVTAWLATYEETL